MASRRAAVFASDGSLLFFMAWTNGTRAILAELAERFQGKGGAGSFWTRRELTIARDERS